MSLFLPKLDTKKEVDQAIKTVEDKVLVLRFGRDTDSVCMQLDEIVRTKNVLKSIHYHCNIFLYSRKIQNGAN